MAGRIIILADQGGSTTEESVGTGSNNDAFCFTLFASRTTIDEMFPSRE